MWLLLLLFVVDVIDVVVVVVAGFGFVIAAAVVVDIIVVGSDIPTCPLYWFLHLILHSKYRKPRRDRYFLHHIEAYFNK